MHRIALFACCVLVLFFTACVTTVNPYPPFDGRWLYDYAESVDDTASLPPDFQEMISRLDREGRSEDHKRLEAIAMRLQPPEILVIEYVSTTMVIRGGGAFERRFELSNLNPTPGVEVTWNMRELEVKMADESIEVVEHYALSQAGNRLTVSITMIAPLLEEPLEMKRVYMSSSAF